MFLFSLYDSQYRRQFKYLVANLITNVCYKKGKHVGLPKDETFRTPVLKNAFVQAVDLSHISAYDLYD